MVDMTTYEPLCTDKRTLEQRVLAGICTEWDVVGIGVYTTVVVESGGRVRPVQVGNQ